MRIEQIHIQGFGVWHQQSFELNTPVALFYGRNESGKSTLMSFIRYMLFGAPTRAMLAELAPPEIGAEIGGRLIVTDHDSRRYIVERYRSLEGFTARRNERVRITLPDGTVAEREDEFAQRLLGGITAQLYRNLFAFSLSELQLLSSLESDEIGGYLFSSGYGIAAGTVMSAEKTLEQDMDKLYRPRGQNLPLNQSLQALAQMEKSLIEYRERSGVYNDRVQELADIEREIHELEADQQAQELQLRWLGTCIAMLPHWLRRSEILKELEELPQFTAFPYDALNRYEHMQQQKDELEYRIRQLDDRCEHLRSKVSDAEINEQLISISTQLADKLEQYSAYEQRRFTLAELSLEQDYMTQEINRYLKQIDAAWTEDDAGRFPLSLADQEAVRAKRLEIQAALEKQKDAEREVSSCLARQKELQESIEKLRAEADDLQHDYAAKYGVPAYQSEDMLEQLQRLKEMLDRLRQLGGERRNALQRRKDIELMNAQLAEQDALEQRNHVPLNAMLWLSASLSLALPIYLLIEELLFGALACLLFFGGWSVYLYRLKSNSRKIKRAQIRSTHGKAGAWRSATPRQHAVANDGDSLIQAVLAEITALDQEIAALSESAAELARVWMPGFAAAAEAAAATSLSVKQAAEAEGPDRRVAQLHEGLHEQQWDKLRQQVEDAITALHQLLAEQAACDRELRHRQTQLRQIAERVEHAQSEAVKAQHEAERAAAQWQAWLQKFRLPNHATPDAVLHIFTLVEQMRRLLADREAIDRKISHIQTEVNRYEQELCVLLGMDRTDRLESTLRQAMHEAEQQRELAAQLKFAAEELAGLEDEIAVVGQRFSKLSGDIERLVHEAGAASEEEFRSRIMQFDRCSVLIEEKRQLDVLLEHAAGDRGLEGLSSSLRGRDQEQFIQEQSIVEEELDRLRAELNRLKEKRGRLLSELERMGTDEEHADLLRRREEQWSLMQAQTEAWAKRALALQLIRTTRRKAEQERQPAVMVRASDYFSAMTGGSFRTVAADAANRAITVERMNGTKLSPAELSRGTAEQLYLAIRFALAGEFSKHAIVPMMLDDIFVNFDRERLVQSLQILNRLAKTHQVLLFTCHDHVRDAVKDTIVDAQLIQFGSTV